MEIEQCRAQLVEMLYQLRKFRNGQAAPCVARVTLLFGLGAMTLLNLCDLVCGF